jgi:hypothetical protein
MVDGVVTCRDGSGMSEIGLAEVIEQVRAELARAVAARPEGAIEFPVESVSASFQVGVMREGGGEGGINVWVLQLGASGKYAQESVQTITLELGAPVDGDGNPVRVASRRGKLPE